MSRNIWSNWMSPRTAFLLEICACIAFDIFVVSIRGAIMQNQYSPGQIHIISGKEHAYFVTLLILPWVLLHIFKVMTSNWFPAWAKWTVLALFLAYDIWKW